VKATLRDSSTPAMLRVLRLALAACAAIYATVAVSGEAGRGVRRQASGQAALFGGRHLPAIMIRSCTA
jgi:hypothetical protein